MGLSVTMLFSLDLPVRSFLGCKVSREYSAVYILRTLLKTFTVLAVVANYQYSNTFRLMCW